MGELSPHLTQRRLSRGLYLRTKWYTDASSRLATIDMGRELGAVPHLGEAGFPSNTTIGPITGAEAYLHAKFHLDPSNRLATIHQRHRLTEQDRTTVP